jgi:hypothetical protein
MSDWEGMDGGMIEGRHRSSALRASALLMLLLSLAEHGWCRDALSTEERKVRKIITWTAAGVSSGVMWAQQIWFEPEAALFLEGTQQWEKLAVTLPSILVYTGVAAWSMHSFTGWYM